MKIVVIGGTGLIGKKLVKNLSERGHDVLAASPNTGVNTITREGLPKALDGAEVVVDVANAPVWEDKAVLEFFETSGRNLLAAEAAAGVRHHVALSIVGSERLPDNGYFRAKVAQESLIKASGIPYTILRATQFFEFVGGIAQSATVGEEIRLSPALIQPIPPHEWSGSKLTMPGLSPFHEGLPPLASDNHFASRAQTDTRPPIARSIATVMLNGQGDSTGVSSRLSRRSVRQ